jgi:hypothetical protein
MKTQEILEALVKNPETVFIIEDGRYAKVTEVVKVKTRGTQDRKELTKFKVNVLWNFYGCRYDDGSVLLPTCRIDENWRPLVPAKFVGIRTEDNLTLEQIAEQELPKEIELFMQQTEQLNEMKRLRAEVAQASGLSAYQLDRTPDQVVTTLHKLLGFQS